MKLSVCIPTHQGRAEVLRQALDSIAAAADRALAMDLEVCISDNASRDGTEAMVARFRAEHPSLEISYGRNERDVGLENILLAVERATGEWCWLFGSDDVMAEDGLERLTAAIAARPDASGIGFAAAPVTHDLSERLEGPDARSRPAWRETRLLTDVDEILVELSLVHGFMGTNAVRRDRWLAAAERTRDEALAHRDWPQLVVLAAMARADPTWIWLPATLVKARAGDWYLTEGDRDGPDLSRMHERLVGGLDAVWRTLADGDTPLYRRGMAKGYFGAGSSYTVAHIKDSRTGDVRGDLALLRTFTRAFWWLPEFRRRCLPLLFVPGPVWRVLRRRQMRRRGGPMQALPAERCAAALTCALPDSFYARETAQLECTVRNTGTAELRSTDPHPVHVSYRWLDERGELVLAGLRTALRRPLAPGQSMELTLRLLVPWDAGTYHLWISPVQELVAWFDDLDRANGLQATVPVVVPG